MSVPEGREGSDLRVGMTGHIGLDPGRMDALEKGIEEAIHRIEEMFPDRALTAVSSLAMGADRMVTRAILKRPGSKLMAALPLPPDEYVKDFGPSEARQEFHDWLSRRATEVIVMPPSATRDESYEKAGNFTADHGDVMIVVWDGKGSQGRGGTADIVKRVRDLRKPLCHVWAGNYKKEAGKRTNVGRKHGKVTFENFPGKGPRPCENKEECQ
jgi:hypothetical protein